MSFQLVVVQGRSASQALKVGSGVMTVGRQQDCQLRIASSQVSRKHCQIFEKKGLLLVKDLGSANGTLVNGKKIADQRVLEVGDELTVGSVKFRVERLEETALIPGQTPLPNDRKPGDTDLSLAIATEENSEILDLDDEDLAIVAPPAATPAKPAAKGKSPAPAAEDDAIELGEDDVADFLMNIELDEEDKL